MLTVYGNRHKESFEERQNGSWSQLLGHEASCSWAQCKHVWFGMIIITASWGWENEKVHHVRCLVCSRHCQKVLVLLFSSYLSAYLKREIIETIQTLVLPCDSAGKESTCNEGDLSSIPGLGRSPREGKGYPLQYSGLENSMDCIVHGVA